jgi:CRP-like cAMP-binding protein
MFNRLKEYSGDSHIAGKYPLNNDYNGFRLINYDAGQKIRQEGSPDFETYLLLSGSAYSKYTSPHGKEIATGLYLPPSLLGSNFTPHVSISIDTVEVLGPSQLVAIYKPEVTQLYSDPQAIAELALAVENDAYNTRRLMIAGNQEYVLDRVGHLLYFLTQDGSQESPRFSQEVLARLVNSQRPSVSTSLKELIGLRYIERASGINKGSFKLTPRGRKFYAADIPQ